MIYADNAATTRMSKEAIEAMLPFMDKIYGNPSSPYSFGQEAKRALEDARSRIAFCIGAEAKEITFTSGGSESCNQAILSAARYGALKGKKHIITTAFEHHCVLNTLARLKKEGFEVTYLDVHNTGLITPGQVLEALREDTCLVTIMYANNEIGTIEPISEIGAALEGRDVIFHTDAVQAAGHLNIDVKKEKIDMLSLSAHKFRGPKGTGILYARREIPLEPVITGGSQERGKRAGTENVAGICGMARALEISVSGIGAETLYLTALRDKLIAGLDKIPASMLNGDHFLRLPSNVNFSFEGIRGESLLMLLDSKGILASAGSACTSGSLEPSHVLLAIGRSREAASGSLRLTLGEDITEDDIDYVISAVTDSVSYLRNMTLG